ncbi:MAG TPA: ABC transporter substrate-binding protein [Spirochaetia bacterium]|nr:ABC transporter substrate-binding protein [Spirochaetia bacterium]
MKRGVIAFSILVCLAGAAFAADSGAPVVVGSKIDTEGTLLGKMIVKLLSAGGIPVTDKVGFGTTPVVRKAIAAGELDIYPEYTGNGGFFFDGTDPGVWKDEKKGYETVKKLDFDKNGIVWLTPAPANNTWAIAVRKDVADKNKLVTLDDMARFVNAGGAVKLAGSEEFISRPDALPAFQKAYGFTLKNSQLLSLSGGNTALTEAAAARGTDGVNFAMAYGTDGSLFSLGLVVLTDTRGVQPIYEPTAIIRKDTLARYPSIDSILKPVFLSLNLTTLQSLNARIAVNGENAEAVAVDYLTKKGFLK